MKPNKQHQISITRWNTRGNGEGVYYVPEQNEGMSPREAEVPFTCPGDVIESTLGSKKKGIRQGSLLNILTPSPERISPRCIHFSICGGCRFQHISYEEQLRVKENWINDLFNVDTSVRFPILPAESPWNYRNKMEFTFNQNKQGDRFLGLMMAKGRVVDLQECHLVEAWFVQTLSLVREWWNSTSLAAYHPYKDTGSLRTLTLREGKSSGDRFVLLTVSGNPDYALHKNDLHTFVEKLKESIAPTVPGSRLGIGLRIHQAIKGQPTQFYDLPLYGQEFVRETLTVDEVPLDFQINPVSFFQPNPRQAEKLFTRAIELAEIGPEAVVYDLFSGTGTIGICVAPKAKQVVGIEMVPEAVYDARANAQANGLDNVTFLQGDVFTLLEEIIKTNRFPSPDVVFVDPPRAGLGDKTIETLLSLLPPTILYISCNPKTQAEDIKKLSQKYTIAAIQPVDQFPQTPHVENIVSLRRL